MNRLLVLVGVVLFPLVSWSGEGVRVPGARPDLWMITPNEQSQGVQSAVALRAHALAIRNRAKQNYNRVFSVPAIQIGEQSRLSGGSGPVDLLILPKSLSSSNWSTEWSRVDLSRVRAALIFSASSDRFAKDLELELVRRGVSHVRVQSWTWLGSDAWIDTFLAQWSPSGGDLESFEKAERAAQLTLMQQRKKLSAVFSANSDGKGIQIGDLRALYLQIIQAVASPEREWPLESARSVKELTSFSKDRAWKMLSRVGKMTQGTDPEDPEEIWLDGDSLRSILDPAADDVGPQLSGILAHLQGARISRTSDEMKIAILLDQELSISLTPARRNGYWDVKAQLRLPKEMRLNLQGSEENFMVDGLANRTYSPRVRVQWGFLPAQWFGARKFVLQLTTGKAYIEAGLFDNRIGMVLKTELTAKSRIGFDFWQSLQSNVDLFRAGNWAFRTK